MRLNPAALEIRTKCTVPGSTQTFDTGDEAALAAVLTPAAARDLVRLGAITPAVLGDPDPVARIAFEALSVADLDELLVAYDVAPVGTGPDGQITTADKIDALLNADVPVPA